ncbi:hypothetical protein CHS0354_041961 [Potamilus streckersoni]|uniref:Metalloendopeptidase n=1 Tax=Potamilus streckersoni TaxID=2493646 RepID=A0AAE0T9W4_9BIVA|nr:hypothetical protein CHS0354_041961 [Potamilus streckersoni]
MTTASHAILCHWCNGQSVPEDLQQYNFTPPSIFGRESPTNKTIDQLIMDAMGGLKGALSLKTINGGILMELDMLLSKQQYYSLYEQPNSCYSQLGMVGGQQVISLSSDKCRYTGLYLHEIGHAIGLVHEHQLPNRDDYVEIITENVQPGMLDQFTKYTSQIVDQMNVPYEYSSVMHYGVTAFSKDGVLKTIRVKYPEKEASIGQVYKKELSFTDVEIVNKMYKCSAKCDPNIKCSAGYVDENCRCVCKNGSEDCQIGGGIKPSGTCGVNTYGDSWKCFVWAQRNQCEENPNFMYKSCARACGPCGLKRKPETCVKMYPSNKCLKWARNGDCQTNAEWMNNYCCGTCVNSNNGTGCQNKHNNALECDRWANEGECDKNPMWMIPNCRKSCRACDNSIPTQAPTTTPSPDIGNCTDKHDAFQCKSWAQAGECDKNPAWMVPNCQRSCGKCSLSGCINLYNDIDCDTWAASNECDKNPLWMIPNCRKSCRACDNSIPTQAPTTTPSPDIGNCTDKHDAFQCKSWAQAGECDKNPAWMVPNCQRSCGKCSLSGCINLYNDIDCDTWAASNECDKNPLWMIPNCRKSCRACDNSIPTQAPTTTPSPDIGNCTDKHDAFQCKSWAQAGECDKNPAWMVPNCQRSCGKCSLSGRNN